MVETMPVGRSDPPPFHHASMHQCLLQKNTQHIHRDPTGQDNDIISSDDPQFMVDSYALFVMFSMFIIVMASCLKPIEKKTRLDADP
jgi:hypothetical protein